MDLRGRNTCKKRLLTFLNKTIYMKNYIPLAAAMVLIAAASHAQVTSTDGTFTAISSNLTLRTGTVASPVTRLTILNTNGFVGIGVTNPSTMLHIGGDITAGSLTASGNVAASGNITATQFSANTGSFSSTGGSSLSFNTNGTTRLTVLNSNGSVGIGTATPSAMLHVAGNILSTSDVSSTRFSANTGNFNSIGSADLSLQTNNTSRITVLNANGYVGIGTNTPAQLLHISGGNMILDNDAPTIYTGTTANSRYVNLASNASGQPSPSGLKAGGILIADDFNYSSPSKNDLVVKGHVGIGTPLSSNLKGYALAVNGKIAARDLLVETTSGNWPDYVFSSGYHLPSLYDVESYVKENKHLQDVPSAQQIEEKHSVGEMDAILLKKVEELTLYIIEQQKQIDALKQEVRTLKKQ